MALVGKLEADVHIKAPADKFHEIFHSKTHHLATVSPHIIQSLDIHEGELGTKGFIIFVRYKHNGKDCVAKEVVEDIDWENNSITFKVLEGDLLEDYKSFKFIIQVTPQEKGSLVHWIMEYEKLKDHVVDPHTLMQLVVEVSKGIEAYLTQD